jgi:hypothetical protein
VVCTRHRLSNDRYEDRRGLLRIRALDRRTPEETLP